MNGELSVESVWGKGTIFIAHFHSVETSALKQVSLKDDDLSNKISFSPASILIACVDAIDRELVLGPSGTFQFYICGN